MLSFENDYAEGAHEKILEKLAETNREQLSGYGSDIYTYSAKEKIRNECGCPEAEVFLMTGGTQTNMVVIASILRSYEGVIAAKTGHVSIHEAGAIEHSGHKVLELPSKAGKIAAADLRSYLHDFYLDENKEHMVFPGMVYISYPTEYGTLYTKEELESISGICREYRLPLYIDGARLDYGLMSRQADLTLPDIAALCDVFYIGGTKVGALCGEAVVFPKKNMPEHFMTTVKQHGALTAKGRLLGIQFDVLFTDRLYFTISRHAVDMAEEMKRVFHEKNYRFFMETPTNQQFIILDNDKMESLKKQASFSFWEKYDETHTVVRFASSWATEPESIEALRKIL